MYTVLVRMFKEFRRLSVHIASRLASFVGAALLVSLLLSSSVEAIEMQDHPELLTLAEELVEQGFDRSELQRLFGAIEFKQSIIDAMTKPAEKSMTWKDYRGLFIKPERIQQGIEDLSAGTSQGICRLRSC